MYYHKTIFELTDRENKKAVVRSRDIQGNGPSFRAWGNVSKAGTRELDKVKQQADFSGEFEV